MEKKLYKKIGCISLFGYYNYGNHLQNYAVQYIFKSLGYYPVLLVPKRKLTVCKEQIEYNLKSILAKVLRNNKGYSFGRFVKFYSFASKNLNIAFINESRLKDNSFIQEFFKFSIGSDQVWNPKDANEMYFLDFVESEKKICVAPSFGVASLPKKYNVFFSKMLNNFETINVRESAGADIVYELTGEKCKVIVDPTMAVKKEVWEEFVDKDLDVGDYIFCYFLGEDIYKDNVDAIADKLRCKIINVSNRSTQYYGTGPEEFLTLIHNAKLVLTDSFHAVVFSIIFNKPFIAYDRVRENEEKMNSRLDSLLRKYNFENRKNGLVEMNTLCSIDFNEANNILKHEEERFIEEIKEQLER